MSDYEEREWLEKLPQDLQDLFNLSHAKNTNIAYKGDIEDFMKWALKRGVESIPCSPLHFAEYLVECSKVSKVNTVKRRASGVSYLHRQSGYLGKDNPREDPLIKETIRLIARRERETPIKKSKELTPELIRAIVTLCKEDENTVKGVRDRALILIGFSSAMRRSNLSKIKIEDIDFVIQGLEINIPFSKTDQQGQGHVCRLAHGQVPATCPVTAMRDWLLLSDIRDGFIFCAVNKSGKIGTVLSGQAVWRIVKARLKELGRADWDDFGGHSLRSGFASTAAENGASIQAIKSQGGWKRDATLRKKQKGQSYNL